MARNFRERTGNRKTHKVYVTPVIAYELASIKEAYKMPEYYREGDVLQAILRIFHTEEKNKTPRYCLWVGAIGDKHLTTNI